MNRQVFETSPLASGKVQNRTDLDFVQVLRILWAGGWIICAGALLGAVLSAIIVLRETPTYTAAAQIMLGQKNRADDTLGNLFQELNLDNADIAGEIAIISSGQILTGVSRQLELSGNPEFNASLRDPSPEPSFVVQYVEFAKEQVKRLLGVNEDEASAVGVGQGAAEQPNPVQQAALAGRTQFGDQADFVGALAAGLHVRQVGSTYLVNVRYSSSDPQLAAAVPNTVVDVYLREQLNRKFDAIQRVTTGLEARLMVLRERLELAEQSVVQYRNQNLAQGFGTKERLEQQLRELSSRLGGATAERTLLATELAEIDALIARGGAVAAAGLFTSDVLDKLRAEILDVEQREALWRARFGEESLQVQEARDDIARLEQVFATEINRLREDKVNLVNVAVARVTALKRQLGTLEQQELDLSKRAVTMAQLERELQANRVTYESFLAKFTETNEVVDLQEADAHVIAYAQPPKTPAAPRKKLAVALGLFGGAVLATGLVFLLALRSQRITSLGQLRVCLNDAHVMALPRLPRGIRRRQPQNYILQKQQSHLSESVRALRGHLLMSAKDTGQVISIVSCNPYSGKTTTSVMLGRTIAQMGKSCVLVEGDLRRGDISKKIGASHRPDLVDILNGSATLATALQRDPLTNMFVLHARSSLQDPAALLMLPQMEQLIAQLKAEFDVVLFDTAPLLSVTDSLPLVQAADQVVLLVQDGKTKESELENGLRVLRKASARLSCGVLSMARKTQGDTTYDYY